MSFNRINHSEKFYEEGKNFTFDGSLVFNDASVFIKRNANKEMVFRDPSTGEVTLYDLYLPTSLNVNVGDVWFVSTNGNENGVKGNPTKPYDISTAVNSAAEGELLYFYSGDYGTFEQAMDGLISRKYYFQPNAQIDFGTYDAGLYTGIWSGLNTEVYGYGIFTSLYSYLIDTGVNYFEFDEATCRDRGFCYSSDATSVIKGRKITLEDSSLAVDLFLGGYTEFDEIYINNSHPSSRIQLDGVVGYSNTLNFRYIYSNTNVFYASATGGTWVVNGGAVDCSGYLWASGNSQYCPRSVLNISDVSVFGSSTTPAIASFPWYGQVNIKKLLTNSKSIQLEGTKVVYNLGTVISSNDNAVFATWGSDGFVFNADYVESLSTHAVNYHVIPGVDNAYFNIKQLKCPSTGTYAGYYLSSASNPGLRQVLIRDGHIEGSYPIYLAPHNTAVVLDYYHITLENMTLYAESGNNSIYSTIANTKILVDNVWANTDPRDGYIWPIGDGINVDSERVYPFTPF